MIDTQAHKKTKTPFLTHFSFYFSLFYVSPKDPDVPSSVTGASWASHIKCEVTLATPPFCLRQYQPVLLSPPNFLSSVYIDTLQLNGFSSYTSTSQWWIPGGETFFTSNQIAVNTLIGGPWVWGSVSHPRLAISISSTGLKKAQHPDMTLDQRNHAQQHVSRRRVRGWVIPLGRRSWASLAGSPMASGGVCRPVAWAWALSNMQTPWIRACTSIDSGDCQAQCSSRSVALEKEQLLDTCDKLQAVSADSYYHLDIFLPPFLQLIILIAHLWWELIGMCFYLPYPHFLWVLPFDDIYILSPWPDSHLLDLTPSLLLTSVQKAELDPSCFPPAVWFYRE